MPVSLGSKCVFKFVLPQKIIGSDTLRVNLSNVRRTISGTGENRSVKHSILWCCVMEIPLKNVRVISGKMEGEVEITIPYDCFEHDKSDPKNMVFWQLQISAETPEIDFAADFPIPVFKTEKSDPAVYGSAEDEKEVLAGEPKIKGIQFQQIPEGLRLFIKPFRFISSAISTFLLGSLFAGVGIGMCIYGIWFGIIFAIIGFLILVFSIHFLLIQTEIVFFKDKGQVKSTWLGLGVVREFDLSVIKDIRPKISTQSHSDISGDKCQYTVEIIPQHGKILTLCDLTRDYSQALWIAAKLKEYLRLSAADNNHS